MSVQPCSSTPSPYTYFAKITLGIATASMIGTIAYRALKWIGHQNEKKNLELYSHKLNEWCEKEKTGERGKTIREKLSQQNETLDLSELDLTTLPPIYKPERICTLNLSSNSFTTTPSFALFTNLRTLYLQKSGLTSPPDLRPLKHLKSVDLSVNALTEIPLTDPSNPQRITINLSWNQIEQLHNFNSEGIQTLILTGNLLSEESIQKIENLNKKNSGCEITNDPTPSIPRALPGGKPLGSSDSKSPSPELRTPIASNEDLSPN